MSILIKGGRVLDPGNCDAVCDLIIEDGKIVELSENVKSKENFDRIIDATGKIVTPGLIDMHVHLREPGHEYKETIKSGTQAAACGGFTAVCCMPNTSPVNDSRQVTEYILSKAKEAGFSKVYPVAAISPGLCGKNLSEFGELKEAGAIAVTDDGQPVSSSQLMRRALEYAKGFDLTVISHAEDLGIANNGSMNEGAVATQMGLAGIPNASESVMVMRDIALCELTGSKLHIAHVSTREAVQAIREAKNKGIRVSAETAPHYFTLTDSAVEGYNTNAKMNPPLRSADDRDAIREGLSDGTIDAIATDHAPHSILEKDVEFSLAANGIIGLETSVSLGLKLVNDGFITLAGLIEKMSKNPAGLLGLNNDFKPGNTADITIIDLELPYRVISDHFYSLSRNTPFEGWELKGKPVCTIVDGKVVFEINE